MFSAIIFFAKLIVVVHSLTHVWLFVTPQTTARQASPVLHHFWSLIKLAKLSLLERLFGGCSMFLYLLKFFASNIPHTFLPDKQTSKLLSQQKEPLYEQQNLSLKLEVN